MTLRLPIPELRPTQLTVGLREAEAKRYHWERADHAGREALLETHVAPVVLGPRGRTYLIDHHHFARALADAGAAHLLAEVTADLSGLRPADFWASMELRHWMHPYDAHGERRGRHDLPRRVAELVDDPYRSLAGALRDAGGYAKCDAPFAEFLWADFLRRRVKRRTVRHDFETAVREGLALARGQQAAHLPGHISEGATA